MNKFLKISIVTPSYNQGKFIEDAIQSVLLQNYPNFEHIIIDNCSTDGTLEILKAYPHLIRVSEPDRGQSDALNKGFKMATGNIIGWLNADDYYLPNCFWIISKFIKNNPKVDIVYGDYRWVDENGKLLKLRRELDFDLFMLKYLHVLYIPTTASFFKSKILQEGNLLDVSYKYAMDYEFFLRLALKEYKFAHTKYFLADFRWHTGSKSSSSSQKQYEEQGIALLRHDVFLNSLPLITRKFVRYLLMVMARVKRYFLKFIFGYYLEQFLRGRKF